MGTLLLVCGSLRTGSSNGAVLATAATLAPEHVTTSRYTGLGELPHFNPDDDRDPLPPAVAELRARLGEADAVLFCTPEYAGALPGSFKNLLDWSVGGGEMDGKPVAWINSSAHLGGAAKAHESLRIVLGYTGSDIVDAACANIQVGQPAVGADGLVHDPAARAAIAAVVKNLVDHVTA
ncbi:NADPH-dependent FMN reductase [Actinokineospora sp.]|uniref:NADPH-dependent FMN reductase n=1 Tax=Actinokineospora sp. TaxID=1872133 RepID=UPI004037C56D